MMGSFWLIQTTPRTNSGSTLASPLGTVVLVYPDEVSRGSWLSVVLVYPDETGHGQPPDATEGSFWMIQTMHEAQKCVNEKAGAIFPIQTMH